MSCRNPVGYESGASSIACDADDVEASWYRRAARCLHVAALEALSPTRCAGCERPGTLICERCLARLPLIDPRHACMRCGAPFGEILCTECDRDGAGANASPVARCLAMATYEDPLDRIIRVYKDAGERGLAPLLAEMLADTAAHAERVAPERYGGVVSDADALVFVPATAVAYVRRGYDHMEQIAAELSRRSGVPMLDALAKLGGADQRALGRKDRRAGMRGVFEVVERVRDMRLVLVDDVCTTGATLDAAAEALRRAGAHQVDALVLARVWGR